MGLISCCIDMKIFFMVDKPKCHLKADLIESKQQLKDLIDIY